MRKVTDQPHIVVVAACPNTSVLTDPLAIEGGRGRADRDRMIVVELKVWLGFGESFERRNG